MVIDDLTRHGGGQMYGLILAEVLEEIGYNTYFLTNIERHDGSKSKVAFKVDYEYVEGESKILDLFKVLNLKRQLSRIDLRDFNLTVNNHPNVFIKKGDLNILHGFSFLDPWLDEKGELMTKFPAFAFKLSRFYKVYEGQLFIPNSNYTREISKKLFGALDIDVRVGETLHPPVRTRNFDDYKKKEQVIVFGRISRNKGIEGIIDIARDHDIKIVIAGFVNRGDKAFVERLKKRAGNNVEIRSNLSNDEKEKLFMESSTILSLNKKEHFGMALAEAMNYGCVPVVPKSGGQWTDVVDEGSYGIGYDSLNDIGEILEDSFDYAEEQRRKIAMSVARFSVSEFRKSLERILDVVNSNLS